jgi:hypothetical protein
MFLVIFSAFRIVAERCLRSEKGSLDMKLTIAAVATMLLIASASAQQQKSDTDKSLSVLLERVRDSGIEGSLSPYLSFKLGIASKPERVHVRQISYVTDHGKDSVVEAFNVPTETKADVIILFTTIKKGPEDLEITLYLTSTSGVLLNAVNSRKDSSSPTGVVITTTSDGTLSEEKAKTDFAAKKKLWASKVSDVN